MRLFVFNPLRGMHPLHLTQLQKCVAVPRWSRTMAGEFLLIIFYFLGAWMKQEHPEETHVNTRTSKYHAERLQSGLEERPAVRRHWIIVSPTVQQSSWIKWSHTCLEVGDDGAAGEGSFGGVEGDRVGGAWLKVGQLVLLLVAFHKESISCHWKTHKDYIIRLCYIVALWKRRLSMGKISDLNLKACTVEPPSFKMKGFFYN